MENSRAFFDNQRDMMNKPIPPPKVYAFTATLPDRAEIAKQAIKSILPQVDEVQVVCNNFPAFYDFGITSHRLRFVHHDNSLADGSRFINVDEIGDELPNAYILVFDDDIIYPPDYVQTLIAKHKQYGGFITPMGKILKARPINSYYKDIAVAFRAFNLVTHDVQVQVPGACGILWHSSEVHVSTRNMEIPNSDLCLAKVAKDQGVKCTVIAHAADWLTNLWKGEVTQAESIYGKYRHNDKIQTDFVNAYL